MSDVKVLIVEDDLALRGMYDRILHKKPWQIHQAKDGEQAITYLEQNIPHLIFLDMLLPHVSGRQVLEYIISQPRLRDAVHVVIVSSSQEYEQYVGSLPSCEFILKPILPSQIQDVLLRFSEKLPR